MAGCGTCGGDGYIDGDICSSCYGTGDTPVIGIIPIIVKKVLALQETCNDILDKCNDIMDPVGTKPIYTYQIVEATVDSEYNALTESQKNIYKMIISVGVVDFSEGSQVRTKLLDIFGEETTTRNNLLEL
jgi:DnaJ-class molecular chaperone